MTTWREREREKERERERDMNEMCTQSNRRLFSCPAVPLYLSICLSVSLVLFPFFLLFLQLRLLCLPKKHCKILSNKTYLSICLSFSLCLYMSFHIKLSALARTNTHTHTEEWKARSVWSSV